jgi:uncharacterized protein
MRILVTGASGLVGSSLVPYLSVRGNSIVKLTRGDRHVGNGPWATWNPEVGKIDLSNAGSLDAAVHLAGEPIAQRWTAPVKQRIRDSRVNGTRLLCQALARLPQPPTTLVCASATGFYGDRGDEWLDEGSRPGTGFLAEVCREWEAATELAAKNGIRAVQARSGIVLAAHGGALAKMLSVFRLGAGGRLADGRAYWSWIALNDLLGVIHHALTNESVQGAVNAVSPNPVTNAEFTKTLGRVLHRPAIFPAPRFALELLLGEMAREAVLASCRVKPAKLVETGFKFQYPELEGALRHLLSRNPAALNSS